MAGSLKAKDGLSGRCVSKWEDNTMKNIKGNGLYVDRANLLRMAKYASGILSGICSIPKVETILPKRAVLTAVTELYLDRSILVSAA